MVHILPCNAAQRHRSCDTYPRISPLIVSERRGCRAAPVWARRGSLLCYPA
ncbi:hypothetical protein BCONGLO52_08140 [Brachybacterium conglomeratum]|uniref:Uncharacterized protein n=1 Tax=Brachybacterium conglomeratum TaxID=47846 RepID=A0ABQ5RDJ9_9MICO|nr:hypothetical protein BCONGLO52_08140 [Brachybacterium conglomeratum]GLK05850.1 hypothetical protein GCM10017597_26500 [Brachybacterium conglomeratum]